MNLILPFISVALGAILVFFGLSKSQERLRSLLAFSGTFLLATTITSLLPEIFAHGNSEVSYWILAGIVIQINTTFHAKTFAINFAKFFIWSIYEKMIS